MTAVEVRIPSLLGEHKVQMTSLAQIDRSLAIELARIRQVRRLRNTIGSSVERVSWAACDALLDARLAWIEADMARLVDAWGQMPDFSELVLGQVPVESGEEVAA